MTNEIIPKVSEIEISYKPVIKPSEMVKITCSKDAEKILRSIGGNDITYRESFYPIYLNKVNKVLGYQLVSLGGIPGTVVDVRCIYQAALKALSSNLILSHNYPSGNGEPSDADIKITKKLKEAGNLMRMNSMNLINTNKDLHIMSTHRSILIFPIYDALPPNMKNFYIFTVSGIIPLKERSWLKPQLDRLRMELIGNDICCIRFLILRINVTVSNNAVVI